MQIIQLLVVIQAVMVVKFICYKPFRLACFRRSSTAGGDNTRGAIAYDHSANSMSMRVNNDTKMRIDSGGSIAIGAFSPSGTPSSDYRSIEIGRQGNTITGSPFKSALYLSNNATITAGSTAFTYRFASENSNRLDLEDGNFIFSNAGSGTAGATISWNERMRIDSSGNVGISNTNIQIIYCR